MYNKSLWINKNVIKLHEILFMSEKVQREKKSKSKVSAIFDENQRNENEKNKKIVFKFN